MVKRIQGDNGIMTLVLKQDHDALGEELINPERIVVKADGAFAGDGELYFLRFEFLHFGNNYGEVYLSHETNIDSNQILRLASLKKLNSDQYELSGFIVVDDKTYDANAKFDGEIPEGYKFY